MARHDLIIIGGGPAGLTAALYGSRAGLDTVVFEYQVPGGQIATTDRVENYPGAGKTTGPELAAGMVRDALSFGADLRAEQVIAVRPGEPVEVVTPGAAYAARAVIIATGARPRPLGVEGEERLRGRGVSYCATCDGAFFRDAPVAVVGGGDAAVQEALFLTRFARVVTIIHRRDRLRASRTLADRARDAGKIHLVWDTIVTALEGNPDLERVVVQNVKTGERSSVEAHGVFVYIGTIPNTEFLPPEIERDGTGYVAVDSRLMTSVPGIFAAGDVRPKDLRQVVTAVGDGAAAAMAAFDYMEGM